MTLAHGDTSWLEHYMALPPVLVLVALLLTLGIAYIVKRGGRP